MSSVPVPSSGAGGLHNGSAIQRERSGRDRDSAISSFKTASWVTVANGKPVEGVKPEALVEGVNHKSVAGGLTDSDGVRREAGLIGSWTIDHLDWLRSHTSRIIKNRLRLQLVVGQRVQGGLLLSLGVEDDQHRSSTS